MFNRWMGIVSVGLMLSVNAALVVRDLLPGWLAGDPPQTGLVTLRPGQQQRSQVGIYDERGQRVGRSWTLSNRSRRLLTVDTWTLLYPVALPGELTTPRVRIRTSVRYLQNTGLESLEISVYGLGVPASLRGAHVPPHDFPCQWQLGERRGTFVLNAGALRALGDAVRPFGRLPGLYVGQAWRMELFNPLAGLVPGWKDNLSATRCVLVRVTGTEPIAHAGRSVEAFRVEAERVLAWVAPDGRVLRQQVELPLLGRLTLIDEPFDERAYRRAVSAVRRD